jgi:hypothetical protein
LITAAFYAANSSLHDHALRNWRFYQKNLNKISEDWRRCHFEEDEVQALKRVTDSALQAVQTPDHDYNNVFSVLADITYLYLWKVAICCLLDFSNKARGGSRYMTGKLLAEGILKSRDIAAEEFDKVEDELRARGLDRVGDGIFDKVKLLEMVIDVYNDAKNHDEASYDLYPLKTTKGKKVAESYPDPPKVSYSEDTLHLPTTHHR